MEKRPDACHRAPDGLTVAAIALDELQPKAVEMRARRPAPHQRTHGKSFRHKPARAGGADKAARDGDKNFSLFIHAALDYRVPKAGSKAQLRASRRFANPPSLPIVML